MRDPATIEEWTEAVDAADVLLRLDRWAEFGLVAYDVRVNRIRCEQVIAEGRRHGAMPISEAFGKLAAAAAGTPTPKEPA